MKLPRTQQELLDAIDSGLALAAIEIVAERDRLAEEIKRLTKQRDDLMKACGGLLNSGRAPEWPESAIAAWDQACDFAGAIMGPILETK